MGSIFGSGQNSTQKEATAAETSIAKQQATNAGFAADQAKQELPKADSALGTASDFWSAILKGSGASFDKYVAPTRESINESFNAARNTISEFGPRGGGVNSAEADLSNKQATSLSSLVFGAQDAAANNLTNIGSIFGSLGTNELGISAGSNAGAASTLGNINAQQAAAQAAQAQKQKDAGEAAAKLILLMAAA